MENDEENKNAETQSATENTDAGNENKGSTSEGTIANAFGNKEGDDSKGNEESTEDNKEGSEAENKDEKKGGSKASSVAKQNEDGSITFKNQKELDGFISKMYAKGASKAENNNNTQNSKTDENTKDGEKEEESDSQEGEIGNEQPLKDYTDSIALALVEADINPKKARKASRLIDTGKVIINGVLDSAKLEEEINNLVAEWPELKNSNQDVNQAKGFKFGGEGQQDENTEENQLAQIFGNNNN